jgi:hypothetical protein
VASADLDSKSNSEFTVLRELCLTFLQDEDASDRVPSAPPTPWWAGGSRFPTIVSIQDLGMEL